MSCKQSTIFLNYGTKFYIFCNSFFHKLYQKAKEFHDAWERWVPWMPYSATIHRILIHTAEMMRLLPETLTLAHFSEVISVNSVVEFEGAEVTGKIGRPQLDPNKVKSYSKKTHFFQVIWKGMK